MSHDSPRDLETHDHVKAHGLTIPIVRDVAATQFSSPRVIRTEPQPAHVPWLTLLCHFDSGRTGRKYAASANHASGASQATDGKTLRRGDFRPGHGPGRSRTPHPEEEFSRAVERCAEQHVSSPNPERGGVLGLAAECSRAKPSYAFVMGLAALKSAASYQDLLAVPDHLVAEILGGDLYATPRPALPHARAASILGASLTGPFDRGIGGPGGWWILDEPELHLSGDVLVPDLAGWRRERLPVIPAEAFLSLAPDWVSEIISPSTETIDRVKKLGIYAREGVRHVWFINPISQTLEVLQLEDGRWVLLVTREGADPVKAAPFEAIELDLGALWSGTSGV